MAEWVFATQESENIIQRLRVLLLTGTEYLIKGHASNYPAAYFFFLLKSLNENYTGRKSHKKKETLI